MLEYGLQKTPKNNQRWFIKASLAGSEYRYLHLQEKRWWGWRHVHDVLISNYVIKHSGFEEATRQAADDIVREVTVNFKLPTGEVR